MVLTVTLFAILLLVASAITFVLVRIPFLLSHQQGIFSELFASDDETAAAREQLPSIQGLDAIRAELAAVLMVKLGSVRCVMTNMTAVVDSLETAALYPAYCPPVREMLVV